MNPPFKVGLIVVDPFVSSHELDENNNPQMNVAARAWAEVAAFTESAVLLVHHTLKTDVSGQAADIEASRGAKALSDAARIGLTLTTMDADEAAGFGISSDERRRYVRLDDGKANLWPKGGRRSGSACIASP
jgi:RecA-family ATPase